MLNVMIKDKSKSRLWLLPVAVLFLAACATVGDSEYKAGEQFYNQGDYVAAAENAVRTLQLNDEHEEAPALLRRAFPQATSHIEGYIDQQKNSSEEFAYENIVPAYGRLIKLHNDVNALRLGLTTNDYTGQLQEVRTAAAEARYQAGTAKLAEGGFQNARAALVHLRRVDNFASGYKDTADLIQQAEDASMARLYIYSVDSGLYASGDDRTLAGELGRVLMDNDSFAEVTELVPTAALGLNVGMDSSSVLRAAAAHGGIDLLLHVEVGQVEIDRQDLQAKESRFDLGGGVMAQGYVKEASFSLRVSCPWKIYDVKTGSIIKEDTTNASAGDSLRYNYLPSTGVAEVKFEGSAGPRKVGVIDLGSVGITALARWSETMDRNRSFVSHTDIDFATEMWTRISGLVNDIIFYPEVYAFKVRDDLYYSNNYNGMDPTMTVIFPPLEEFVNKSAQIVRAIEANVENKMDENIQGTRSAMHVTVKRAVRSAVAAPLSQ